MPSNGRSAVKRGRSRPAAVRRITDAGLEYLRDKSSYRSLAPFREHYAREIAKGRSPSDIATKDFPPVRIDVMHDGKRHLNDGRHRLLVAKEHGATRIKARVVHYGRRGAIKADRTGIVKVD